MSPEEQRIAIAEACGLNQLGYMPSVITGKATLVHVGEGMTPCMVPDYLNDLNAMHEAEKVLTKEQQGLYLSISYDIVLGQKPLFDAYISSYWEVPTEDAYTQMTLGAPQRAEALLRTLNLWKDTP